MAELTEAIAELVYGIELDATEVDGVYSDFHVVSVLHKGYIFCI